MDKSCFIEAGRTPASVVVGGFPTLSVTRKMLAEMMVSDCVRARAAGEEWTPKLVFSSNGQGIALAGKDASFAAAMAQADVIHADGQSVVIASRRTTTPLPERIATTDFFHDAAQAASAANLSFYILGGSETQNAEATDAIRRIYPNLKIAGRRNGYFHSDDVDSICEDVRRSRADVLWVGLGKPLQEQWCVANRDKLRGVGWVKTCGGLYSFLTGEASRAPRWMQNLGLEWLHRAALEPRRLGWRYLITNPYSLYRLLTHTSDAPRL